MIGKGIFELHGARIGESEGTFLRQAHAAIEHKSFRVDMKHAKNMYPTRVYACKGAETRD